MKDAREARSFCHVCGGFVDTDVRCETVTHTVKDTPITVKANVRHCAKCGEAVFDRDLDNSTMKAVFAAYRSKMGLLQPEEITRIREKYGLTQVAFARILGLGDKTVSRYENGSLQDEAQNNLILLAIDTSNFRKLFEKNHDRLTEEEQQKIEQVLNNVVEYEPRSSFRIIMGGVPEWEGTLLA